MKLHHLLFALVASFLCYSSHAAELYSENFDGLELGSSVDEEVAADGVWTKTAPAGWNVDDTGIPGVGTDLDGVTEWAGWSFASKDWWVETAGDQRRSEFVNGSGTVMIADPDEWDDSDHADSAENGWYDTSASTPPISLTGIAANSVTLDFDSSWRPEFDDNYHQTASVAVSYDGADPISVLLWESDAASANFHDAAPNEHVMLSLDNPAGANSMELTFRLFDAGNDWWWAVDNVAVNAVPEPSGFGLSLIAGLVGLGIRRRRG